MNQMTMRRTLWIVAAFLWSTLPANSGAQVVLPGTQPGEIVNYPLRPVTFCRLCHGQYTGDSHIEPYDTWTGSMMANAARDPLFWAAVDIANQDSPGVGEWCIRCHAPKAWLSGRSKTPNGADLLGPPSEPGNDFEGIDCQFCHRMYEGPTGIPFTQNAQFWVDDSLRALPPPHRGPFGDYDSTYAPPHPAQYSDYHVSSLFCANCHNVKNPRVNLVDENGQDTGLLFPEQTTYDEWNQSSYATSGVHCQSCHMPKVSGYACTDFARTRDLGTHLFAGANAWMTGVLGDLYGESLERVEGYEQSRNTALEMLQNRSALLTVTSVSRTISGREIPIEVRVVNLTGHKLPTGYPEGRRIWIHLTVTDAFRQTIFESGGYDFGQAEIVADANLRVYETKHGIHDVGPGFHLALSNRIYKDTRIPPAGFVPTLETQPVGITFEEMPDGSLAPWDRAVYQVTIPEGTPSPVTVTASLYYQTGPKEYFEFLRDENTSGPDPHDPDPNAPSRGEKIYSLWSQYDRCPPILMRSATRKIILDGPPLGEVADPPDPMVPQITRTGPNPFRDHVDISLSLPRESPSARVQVFDLTGRLVRTLRIDGRETSARTRWDGRDESGLPAATGEYFVRLDAAGFAPHVRRILLLR